MVIRPKLRWFVVLAFAGLGGIALAQGRPHGRVFAALAAIPIAWVCWQRLSADERGITVINGVRPIRVPWAEISGFELGRTVWTDCLDVCRRDGTRVHIWVTLQSGRGSYSRGELSEIADELRSRQAVAAGTADQRFGAGEPDRAGM
jgi:hypothetical protein